MIALLFPALALAAVSPPVSIDGLPIGGLEPQSLPPSGCAAYLFTRGDPRVFVAVASAAPGRLRIALDGVATDLARTEEGAGGGYGLAASSAYRGPGVTATLELTIEPRGDLSKGAAIPQATLRIDRDGRDGLVLPLVGIVGCA